MKPEPSPASLEEWLPTLLVQLCVSLHRWAIRLGAVDIPLLPRQGDPLQEPFKENYGVP